MTYPDQLKQWRARRAAIVKHYRQSGSLRATGLAFEISGERVRQLVQKEQGPPREPPATSTP